MQYTSRIILGMTLALLGLVSPLIMTAGHAAQPLPTAKLVEVQGASSIYRVVDYDGQIITVVVPSQSIMDIKKRSADGMVRATLASVDTTTNRAKVVTHEGQTLVITLESAVLQKLQIGTPVEFVLAPHSEVMAHR